MTQPIGGYFSLELPKYEEYHDKAIKLNTGRNSLEYILRSKLYKKVFIPYYSCSVILEPIIKLGIEYEFYHININLELEKEIQISNQEALLYINYFGLKNSYVKKLAEQYDQRLIIDNTQAFYALPLPGIDTFYSCRKFFGVPDGAYLYTEAQAFFEIEQDYSFERMEFLLKRIDLSAEEGYAAFRKESDSLIGQPIKKMSYLTNRMMQSIDYEMVANRRRANYKHLDMILSDSNKLNIILEEDAIPMIYPYLTDVDSLRSNLIQNKIFVAQYWPNVSKWSSKDSLEYQLAKFINPLPIDQRYDIKEMERITSSIHHYFE